MPSRLFTYTIPFDDGAAPNPFRNLCTLAICKPGIRRVAQVGDWVAGFGSKSAPSGDLSGHLVYAMRIDEVMSLQEYDKQALARWPHRIPDINSGDMSERLGDCIYDFSGATPFQRPGVHDEGNIKTDLSGTNVLVSEHFYYFGSRAIRLPDALRSILHQTQGHKSNCNAQYFDSFVRWLDNQPFKPGEMQGWPDSIANWDGKSSCHGCSVRVLDGEIDILVDD